MSFKALSWAWDANTGSPGRKLVLVGLAQFANDKDECWPSQQTIAERTEQSERTVREHLSWLEEAGFLTRQARSSKGNRYDSDVIKLHLDRLEPKANEERKPAADFAAGDPPPENSASGEKPHVPAANFAGHQRQISPLNLHMNPQFESPTTPPTPQGGRKRSRVPLDSSMFDSLIPIDFQTPEFLEAWHLYVEDRHDRRKTVTDKSAELQIRALVKDAGTPATAAKWIKHSIAQGWTGIFPPKSDAPPRGPRPGPSFRTTADTALADQLARRNHAPAQPNADAVDPGW